MQYINYIIESIDDKLPNINPTQIYNEGWLTRLLMYKSVKEKIKLQEFDFGKFSNWTSEALISSPFVRAERNREGYTRADIVFGDFTINYEVRGEVKVSDEAKIFGIIEAKMGSGLSKGTKNFSGYNQASRNLLCISHNTYNKCCEHFFIVVAPAINLVKIINDVNSEIIQEQIMHRFSGYEDNEMSSQIILNASKCKILTWSYEDWINSFKESPFKDFISDFYQKTKKWNRLKDK